jgi:hypothetical protein
MVRDCPQAKWFPSRHRFALFRLLSLVRAKFSKPPKMDVDHLLLAIDPDQSAVEHYIITLLIIITLTCYFSSMVAWPIAFLIAATAIQACIVVGGLVVRGATSEIHLKRNSFFLMTAIVATSLYFAMQTSSARYVAWFFLGMVSLNALSWLILRILRNTVRELEAQCAS